MTDDPIARLRHDLRSPLTVIAGYARLLAGDDVGDEERRDYAARIREACDEMAEIVDRLGDGRG